MPRMQSLAPAVSSSNQRRAPGMRYPTAFHFFMAARRDPLGLLRTAAAEFGDVVRVDAWPLHVHLLFHPDGIKHVLLDNNRNYWKGGLIGRVKPLIGEGLFTSEGDFWRRQRRLAQPAFHRQRIESFAAMMGAAGAQMLDDWQAAAGLTFNLGLRYDLQKGSFNEDVPGLLGDIQDKLGRDGSFPLDVSVVAQPKSGRGDFNNFGPRVGMAWDPANNGVMNIHAAWGMFYDNMRTLQNFNELTWPQAKQIIISRPTFPDPLGGRTRESFLTNAPPNITVESNATVNPYAHQFNAGVNRSISRDIAVTADISITNRYSDRDTVDPNLPDQTTKLKLYPQFARVNFWQSTANNSYRALLLKVDKRMANRYQFLVSYTLSKAKDTQATNLLGDRYGFFSIERYGAADRRHRLVTSGIVQLPVGFQLSAIADLRSSLRFAPTSTRDLNGDGYTGDLPAGVMPGSGCRDLNLDALNTFRRGRGLTEVTTVDCPGFANVDLRLSKTFRVGAARAEFIAQLFNIFNRANFNTPNVSVNGGNDVTTGRPLFGFTTSLLPNINAPSRQAEFAVRLQF